MPKLLASDTPMNPHDLPCRVSAEERRYDCDRCPHGIREDERCEECEIGKAEDTCDSYFENYQEP